MLMTAPKGHVSRAVPTCIIFQPLLVLLPLSQKGSCKAMYGPGLLEEGPAVDTIHLNNHTSATS